MAPSLTVHATPRVVVTGFEPFGGRRLNRSWEAVRRLPSAPHLETRQLAVDYQRLRDQLAELCERQPAVVLMVGESPGRTLAVEQVALNLVDVDRPDNSGQKPTSPALLPEAPLALRASWDARGVAARIATEGIPASASYHAGAYACNAALFLALASLGEEARVGFLHVPYRRWPRGLRLPTLTRAIEICVESLTASHHRLGGEATRGEQDAHAVTRGVRRRGEARRLARAGNTPSNFQDRR